MAFEQLDKETCKAYLRQAGIRRISETEKGAIRIHESDTVRIDLTPDGLGWRTVRPFPRVGTGIQIVVTIGGWLFLSYFLIDLDIPFIGMICLLMGLLLGQTASWLFYKPKMEALEIRVAQALRDGVLKAREEKS